ncbi:MAG TPA: PmoA family protein, partial [Pyrinomonadaceae bacterium]|nr:PmoA family protein [Pyrinomonadaceae bacterium]
ALLAHGELNAAKRNAYVSVAAGAHDRQETVVSFALPADFKGASYALRDTSGQQIPLQIDSEHNASFVLTLKAGQSKSYQLVARGSKAKARDGVDFTRRSDGLDFKINGRNVFTFLTTPASVPSKEIKPVFLRGGYIHPVITPSGRVVTDDYPSDHYHHHGIWFAWTKTEFEGAHPDFWNVGDGTGKVEFEALDGTWAGPVFAGFKSRQRYVALTAGASKPALNEQWEVRLYNVGQATNGKRYYLFDLVATQQCASNSPLVLEEYRYGGMGVRGHRDWKDKSKVSFLTSEGKTRETGNATRARWLHMSGPVDSEIVGIAVLDHPGNFRSPQPLRIHPDDPYFNYAPSQLGRFEIKPGEKYLVRYRYVVADGAPDKTELDRLWNDYATPPQVSLELK